MKTQRYSLGLDLSTQSLSAAVIDIDAQQILLEHSLNYVKDDRLNTFGISTSDYILPPRTAGEADQPPLMFMAALDALFADLQSSMDLSQVAVINTSGQQHGHVYLNQKAVQLFHSLRQESPQDIDLIALLKEGFAYDRAPIWMTANTAAQAAFIRQAAGGKEKLIDLTGSDAQLRFTGPVVRRTAEQFPAVYAQTRVIQLIGNFVPALLAGNALVPADFGNACGMTLMDYRRQRWSNILLQVTAQDLPGGEKALENKLPEIASPDAVVGTIADYFCHKYGFDPDCLIAAGSGDNPQSKVLVSGDLLSMGSSIVNMVATEGRTMDRSGAACAMYDGVGRPFMFGCRTNGALVWDQVRRLYDLDKENYAPAESALQQIPPGQNLVLWQPRKESFPLSGSWPLIRFYNAPPNLGQDYAGIIESSLTAVYLHSKSFTAPYSSPLYVMGGAASSPGIMRRVAAIWNRPVVITGKAGAALGAAVAGIAALMHTDLQEIDIEHIGAAFLERGRFIPPLPEDVAAFHAPGGYLGRFMVEEAKLIEEYPG